MIVVAMIVLVLQEHKYICLCLLFVLDDGFKKSVMFLLTSSQLTIETVAFID